MSNFSLDKTKDVCYSVITDKEKRREMMRKKKMVSMLLAFSVLASCVAFGSAVEIDETLTVATEITRKIFKANAKESDTIGYISSTYLQGMDGEEDYILSQCVTGGYAIYEAESMELIEYSDT